MKLISLILICLASLTAYAVTDAKDYVLQCTTSVSEVTIAAVGDRMTFHLIDKVGHKNFPIYSGLITPAGLYQAKDGDKYLKEFDHVVDISWDLANCKVNPDRPYLIACSGLGQIANPVGTKIFANSMGSSTEVIESLDPQPVHQMVNFSFGLNNPQPNYKHFFINFPFDANHCSARTPAPQAQPQPSNANAI